MIIKGASKFTCKIPLVINIAVNPRSSQQTSPTGTMGPPLFIVSWKLAMTVISYSCVDYSCFEANFVKMNFFLLYSIYIVSSLGIPMV